MRVYLQKYKYIIIILTFIVFISLAYRSYVNTEEAIVTRYQIQRDLIEKSLISAVKNARIAYTIAEQQLNEEMKQYSELLVEKYRQNPEIFQGDLTGLTKDYGTYDIYIIDSSLKIVNTTDSVDLGLDFSRYPAFSRLLKSRLEGNRFEVDRMDIATNTGDIKKYSYLPTPDHQYLLELGVDISEKYPQLGELNIFTLTGDLVDKYETVEAMEIFKFNEDSTSVGKINKMKDPIDIQIPAEKEKLVQEAVRTNQIISGEYAEPANAADNHRSYQFIPFLHYEENGDLSWWNSCVVGITYDDNKMLTELAGQRHSFYLNVLIITLVFIIFTTTMIYLLKRTEYMAYYDHLTELPNRKFFEEIFRKKINSHKGSEADSALLFLDLDNFKKINDMYGHNIGDKMLRAVAERLKESLRDGDIVSRLGGDEFIILLPAISSRRDAERVAAKIEQLFKQPFIINDQEYYIRVSIGISTSSENGVKLENMLHEADSAMYKSKNENPANG